LTLAILGALAVPGYSLQSKTDPVKAAKAAASQAQKDATAAARRYQDGVASLSTVSDDLAETQNQLDQTQDSIATLQIKASAQAKDAYIRSSEESSDKTYQDVVDDSRHQQFLSTVSEFDDAQLTQLVNLKEDLQSKQDSLASLKQQRKDEVDKLSAAKKNLDAKLAKATKLQKALQAKAKKSSLSNSSKSKTSPGTIISAGKGPLQCPIAGALAFTNDWGNSRSGGRSHKGNDLFNARGTPNVAVTAGNVHFKTGGLGGVAAFLEVGNVTYYYAHLQDTVGPARHVSRGEVIGHTGNTGDARGGPTHTHFEIWVSGNKVNPYATLRSIC
jgi:murein DD-endopeptidase MepM/ murein hydrolase activator NlpD